MISVIAVANSQDKKFWSALQNILSRNFSTIHCIGRCLDARVENADILLTDAKSFDLAYSGTALVLFKEAQELTVGLETQKQAIAIVDSCNKDVLRLVSETGLPAITCGLSVRDTITLSSINEDSAVIDLQRSITCFNGTVVEPQEIPISLYSPIDSFALMCAASIFILSGNINRLSEVKI